MNAVRQRSAQLLDEFSARRGLGRRPPARRASGIARRASSSSRIATLTSAANGIPTKRYYSDGQAPSTLAVRCSVRPAARLMRCWQP